MVILSVKPKLNKKKHVPTFISKLLKYFGTLSFKKQILVMSSHNSHLAFKSYEKYTLTTTTFHS